MKIGELSSLAGCSVPAVRFYEAEGLLQAPLRAANNYRQYGQQHVDRLASLLILDDFGIGEMTPVAAQVLLDVADRRMRSGSLLITSQYPSEKWHDFFPDPTIADAVLDRVVQQAHRLQLKGESMRKLRGRAALASA